MDDDLDDDRKGPSDKDKHSPSNSPEAEASECGDPNKLANLPKSAEIPSEHELKKNSSRPQSPTTSASNKSSKPRRPVKRPFRQVSIQGFRQVMANAFNIKSDAASETELANIKHRSNLSAKTVIVDVENLPRSNGGETNIRGSPNTKAVPNQDASDQLLPSPPSESIPENSPLIQRTPTRRTGQWNELFSPAVHKWICCTLDKTLCCVFGFILGVVATGVITAIYVHWNPSPQCCPSKRTHESDANNVLHTNGTTYECFNWSTTNTTGQPSNKVTDDDLSGCASCFNLNGDPTYDESSAVSNWCGCFQQTMNATIYTTGQHFYNIPGAAANWCRCFDWAMNATNTETGQPLYDMTTIDSSSCANLTDPNGTSTEGTNG